MTRPTAADNFNVSPYYRRDLFRIGLERCGYETGVAPKSNPEPNDVLVLWNRSTSWERTAARYEEAGARVIVVENGYIGKDADGHLLYSMALWQHNGAGEWYEGPEDRWSRLGIEPAPWRPAGDEIVILPQRGFGAKGVAMPKEWTADVTRRLRAVTDRPIRVRAHPGPAKSDPMEDLRNAWAAVTWASGAGIKSIVGGVPVFHELKAWIGGPAARYGIEDVEYPFLGDRLPMLRRLAWSQFSLAEIEAGEPFKWLLR